MVRKTFAYLKSLNCDCDNKSKHLMLTTLEDGTVQIVLA